jgi:hypothetical protein
MGANPVTEVDLANVGSQVVLFQSPQITKAFSLAGRRNGVSTLTFTLTNPNLDVGVDLTGITFTDTLPAGLEVDATPAAATTCGGTPTWAPAAAATTLTFGSPAGATIPANSSCTVSVNIKATTAGPHANVSGFVSSVNGGTNTTSTGYATANLTAVCPGHREAVCSDPDSANGTSTLTFTITNPNQNDALSQLPLPDPFRPRQAIWLGSHAECFSKRCSTNFAPVAGAGRGFQRHDWRRHVYGKG